MSTNKTIRNRIQDRKAEYERLKRGKDALLKLLDEAELSESVYNSNAIENSTLSLKETEKILLEMEVSRDVSVREVFEAKNLARVMEYIREKGEVLDMNEQMLLLLHKMLMGNIDDDIAGRYRQTGEYVRVGSHIAAAPERVPKMMQDVLVWYSSNESLYFVDEIARFHLAFERIHPFNDGNGRIGRVLLNEQLIRSGYPPIIIRDKEKKDYYRAFQEFNTSNQKNSKTMERIVALALLESLHKRIAYLQGVDVIPLTDYARQQGDSSSALLNKAQRQSIPAFREKGTWMIGVEPICKRSIS